MRSYAILTVKPSRPLRTFLVCVCVCDMQYYVVYVCVTVGPDHGQDTIESAAVFLFETLLGREQLGAEETRAIRQMFGPFPASAAEACLASVSRLVAMAGETQSEAFVHTQSAGRSATGRSSSTAFGRNIAFSHESYTLDCHEPPPWLAAPEEDAGGLGAFEGFLNNHVAGAGARGACSGAQGVSEAGASGGGGGAAVGDAGACILREEVEKYQSAGNMMSSSPEELCTSLFEMLASTRSDEELQNEVCSSAKMLCFELHPLYKKLFLYYRLHAVFLL